MGKQCRVRGQVAEVRDRSSPLQSDLKSLTFPPFYNPPMPLIDQIQKDIVTAMKGREEQRLSTLRMVKTALKNKEIDKMAPLDDKEDRKSVV